MTTVYIANIRLHGIHAYTLYTHNANHSPLYILQRCICNTHAPENTQKCNLRITTILYRSCCVYPSSPFQFGINRTEEPVLSRGIKKSPVNNLYVEGLACHMYIQFCTSIFTHTKRGIIHFLEKWLPFVRRWRMCIGGALFENSHPNIIYLNCQISA